MIDLMKDKVKIYALLAAHSYPKRRVLDKDSQLRNKLIHKKTRKVSLELKILRGYEIVSDMTSTKYVTYCNKDKKTVVMSIRGTDLFQVEENDLLTDALLIFGMEKCRNCYKLTYKNLKEIYKRYPKYKVVLVGSSLGGRICIDLLDSDLGKKIEEVHVFNTATGPKQLYDSAVCSMEKIPKESRSMCKGRDKLHIHLINNDPISIMSLGEKAKTRRVHPRKKESSDLLVGKNKVIKTNHSIMNFI
mgnify:FL=1|jgi:hypothetical protein|tara:strand:+ start:2102 stop:2839 length:738 start_codon:yes stop_codon:yes gene_type:complete